MSELTDFYDKLEACKRQAPDGSDYWMGRDIQPLLGYVAWDNFEAVIERARIACDKSGVPPVHQFHETMKVITGGKGAQLSRTDWYLSDSEWMNHD